MGNADKRIGILTLILIVVVMAPMIFEAFSSSIRGRIFVITVVGCIALILIWKKYLKWLYSDESATSRLSQNSVIGHPERTRRILSRVKREVWRRDRGRCVECGSRHNLEYDHIIPFSKGGSNTVRNIELLCEKCNRTKSAKI